jgi:recombination protein RecR
VLTLPPALSELIHRLSRLPGIGPKAAERIALSLLRWEPGQVDGLAAALIDCARRVSFCPRCGCLSQDGEECLVCSDAMRDGRVLCIVEQALDALAIERGGGYSGRYHVLGGALSPMRGVLPEDLRIAQLLERIPAEGVDEVIVATNASPEGEATALYLKEELGLLTGSGGGKLKLTRLARGLPSGAQLDYADAATLKSAIEHRTEL